MGEIDFEQMGNDIFNSTYNIKSKTIIDRKRKKMVPVKQYNRFGTYEKYEMDQNKLKSFGNMINQFKNTEGFNFIEKPKQNLQINEFASFTPVVKPQITAKRYNQDIRKKYIETKEENIKKMKERIEKEKMESIQNKGSKKDEKRPSGMRNIKKISYDKFMAEDNDGNWYPLQRFELTADEIKWFG